MCCDAGSPRGHGVQGDAGGTPMPCAAAGHCAFSLLTDEILRIRRSAVCTSFSLNAEPPSHRMGRKETAQ